MYQDNYFVVSVKINFCQRQTKCIKDQDKFQPVKDTDNEVTECQTPRKKLQSIGISPVSLHAFMKNLKSNISEAQNVQVDCLNNSESDFHDKNEMQKKENVQVRLHEAIQEKWKKHHIQYQPKFFTWYLINGLECTVQNILVSLNTLFELHMKPKKQVKYQQNLLLKQRKAIITETLHLVTLIKKLARFYCYIVVLQWY